MDKPDQRLFEADLASAEFRAGALKGHWGLPGTDVLPEQPEWPLRILWVAAAPRAGAPDRYYLRLDLADYRTVPPTGTFWDLTTGAMLETDEAPQGAGQQPLRQGVQNGLEGWPSLLPPL